MLEFWFCPIHGVLGYVLVWIGPMWLWWKTFVQIWTERNKQHGTKRYCDSDSEV
jgi:hypothetical protein